MHFKGVVTLNFHAPAFRETPLRPGAWKGGVKCSEEKPGRTGLMQIGIAVSVPHMELSGLEHVVVDPGADHLR